MQYLGGKARLSKTIASFIQTYIDEGIYKAYYEPFCGSGAVGMQVCANNPDFPLFMSDTQPDLIEMYQCLQSGWTPPDKVSEEEYAALKHSSPSALRGFVGFGCSYSGKFFGGYARNKRGDDYVAQMNNSLKRRMPYIKKICFSRGDFNVLQPTGKSIIYCDPPYIRTTKYSTGNFDHAAFWNKARELRSDGHLVLISEYSAPDDFIPVWTKEHRVSIRTKAGSVTRQEKIFR